GEVGSQDQIRHTNDPMNGSTDFMTRIVEEITLGTVGGFGSLLCLLQFDFCQLAVGDVHDNSDLVSRLAGFVVNDPTSPRHPADRSIGPHDTVLDVMIT